MAVLLVFALFAGLAVYAVFGDLSGIGGSFVLAGLQVFLFVLLAMTAYLSEPYPGLKIPAVLFLFGLVLCVGLAVVGASVVSILPPDGVGLDMIPSSGGPDADLPEGMIAPDMFLKIGGVILLVFLAVCLSFLGFSRRIRVWLSRYLPFDPDSFLHMVALVAVISLTLMAFVPLVVFGEPIFLSSVYLGMMEGGEVFMESVTDNLYTLFWTIGASFLVVGLFISRNVRDACNRLGLTCPSIRECGIAIGLGIALVGVFHLVEMGIAVLWQYFGWRMTDPDATRLLFAPMLTPVGAVVASVAAGFGEELSIRGVLQPRFGILLPSLLFAALHAFQYNWDGVLSVFLAGIVFALIRRYYCTTVSAVTHTVYDLILFSALIYGMGI